MEQITCEITIDPAFGDILASNLSKTTLRMQKIITETIADVAPKLAVSSVMVTRDDLKGVGDAWVPKDGVICYDNNYLVGVASVHRVPILRETKENNLRNATAHELFHLRGTRPKKRLSWTVSLEEFSQRPDVYNPRYFTSEEEFAAAMFAYRYLESRRPASLMEFAGKAIFQTKEGKRLETWRHEKLIFKYDGRLS